MEDPKVILLIDDEVDIVTMLKGLLTSRGYCVLTAYNGKEGLQKIDETKPHLIVLDINMPEMDGASFYEHIYDRVNKKAKYPVLVLTARSNLGALFAKLDVDGFMSKPFELEAFIKEVEIIMAKRYGKPDDAAFSRMQQKQKNKKKPRKVLVIEDDPEVFGKIVVEFTNRGYDLAGSKNGVAGLEHAMMDPPDMVLIKLGLPDLAGEVVALKLKRLPKTMDIPLLVYQPFNVRVDDAVEKVLCEKAGIEMIVQSNDPAALVKEAERIWEKLDRDEECKGYSF